MIVHLSVVCGGVVVGGGCWEWRTEHPIIDLRLFRDRSFCIGNSMMFMLGFILLGTTLLLPLFTQTMLGYSAEKAGIALMPGGSVILASMPIVGFMLSRYDPRRIMVFGLTMRTAALFYMCHFNLYIDFQPTATASGIQW